MTWLYEGTEGLAGLVPAPASTVEEEGEFCPDPDPDSLALVLWSSGSTGLPKGIKLPFSSLVATCLRQRQAPISNIVDSK